jgi:hypothetical protein
MNGKVTTGENCVIILRSFVIWAHSTRGSEERCMQGFSVEGDKSGDLSVDGRIILKWILREVGWGHGLICLRIGTGGGLL